MRSAILLGAVAGLIGGLAMMFVMLLLRTLAGSRPRPSCLAIGSPR